MGVINPASAPVPSVPEATETTHYDKIRAEIARLDQDASLLRNRSQITPSTRVKMQALAAKSARLSHNIPKSPADCDQLDKANKAKRLAFDHGHALYLKHQAPALSRARQSLSELINCTVPPPLERAILALLADLDRQDAGMRHFTPSQGIPAAMARLMTAYGR
ncbi:MAG: hypothetical protein EX271_07760 [Acidimicrobiales bacterium]|nr:hypothetical protein [Hyphomonadaceae bacterium]RZV41560.1 MAG: hypothetical protein EX271_07760 [Acidimicrobiales bacterium]